MPAPASAGMPLMALLGPDLRGRVRRKLAQRRVSTGRALFRQGDMADALYLVDSGRFRVFVGARGGQERALHFVGPGDVLGEAAFMAETPHATTAVAIDNSKVWRLERADFEALLARHQ